MHSLADVEVASVAQFLPSSELTLFGRCSTRLLSACSTAFATKYCAPVRLCWTGEALEVGSGVLRFAPISLSFLPTVPESASIRLMMDSLRGPLLELDLSSLHANLSVATCLALFSHPASQSLRSVRIDRAKDEIPRDRVLTDDRAQRRWWDAAVIDALAALPRLERLFLQARDQAISPDAFTGAALFPSLMSLSLSDSQQHDKSCLGFVHRCPKLTRLEVLPSLSFFSYAQRDPSCFQHIEHLSLKWLYRSGVIPGTEPAEPILTAGFACLLSVRSLTLSMVFDSELFLAFVHHAPVLTQLTIDCASPLDDYCASATLPSQPRLIALLTEKPRLQCTVQLSHHESPARTEYVDELEATCAQGEPSLRSRLIVLRASADGITPQSDLCAKA